jgi:hypothetical protein
MPEAAAVLRPPLKTLSRTRASRAPKAQTAYRPIGLQTWMCTNPTHKPRLCPTGQMPACPPRRPRSIGSQLDVEERPGARGSQAPPASLIAYWLGVVGTVGSGIWVSWLISWVHSLGPRRFASWCESLLLLP